MNPTRHSSNNIVLAAPKDHVNAEGGMQIDPLSLTRTVTQGVVTSQSFWQPSEEEISRILAGHPISVSVLGPVFYPLYVGVSETL